MLKLNRQTGNTTAAGVWYTIAAYGAWGILPLYWKALQAVPASQILANRVIWSFVFVGVLLTLTRRWADFKQIFSNRKNMLSLTLGSLLISANWFTYIWAVNTDQVIATSLGYYINPLVTVLLGLLVLRERLDRWQIVSLLLATAGVAIVAFRYGEIPWVSLALALTFGLYGLVKKLVKVDATLSLGMETVIVTPLALAYLLFCQINGSSAVGHVAYSKLLLLVLSGVITALPLLWFAEGAKRIPLSTVGFIQYLSPTIGLLLGVFLFKEPFTETDAISFGFIWAALALYTLSRLNFRRHPAPNLESSLGQSKTN